MTNKNRIIFLGDSITDADRDYNAKDGLEGQLGNGFVKIFQSGLKVKYPDQNYEVLNRGVSGNRTIDLLERLKEDVLEYTPDIVFIMIGINDVWRHFDSPFRNIEQIDKDKFLENYESILNQCLNEKIEVVLSSCFFLDTNMNDKMRMMVDEFNKHTESLATKYNVQYIDIQKIMDDFLLYNSSYVISNDQVHLNYIGNYLVAEQYLKYFSL